jgi:mutator protein MutT
MCTSQQSEAEREWTHVGIGIIRWCDRVLIRQRPEGTVYAGYWEFPGGKCEEGELPAQTTARECLEETGIAVIVDSLRQVIEHEYPHGRVRLFFFECRPVDLGAEPSPNSGCRWVKVSDLPGLKFPEANELILEQLARNASGLSPRSGDVTAARDC